MNEKYLYLLGVALTLASFGIIISFVVYENFEDEVTLSDGLPGFGHLQAITDTTKEKIPNDMNIEKFNEFLGNTTYEIKKHIEP